MKFQWWSLTSTLANDDQGMILGQHGFFHSIPESTHQLILLVFRDLIILSVCQPITFYTCTFTCLTLFSISRYSNLGTLIFYSVYLTEYFILIPSFPFSSQVHFSRVLLLRSVVDTPPELIFIVGCFHLVNPLDKNYKTFVFVTYLVLRFSSCIYFEKCIGFYEFLVILKGRCVL